MQPDLSRGQRPGDIAVVIYGAVLSSISYLIIAVVVDVAAAVAAAVGSVVVLQLLLSWPLL